MKQYVATLREKPEHIRKRIAVGTAATITAVVAFAWFGTLAATGAFALSTGTPAAPPQERSVALSNTNIESSWSQLMGAVGAISGTASSTPDLTIVEGRTSTTFDRGENAISPSATVIPF